MAHDPLPPSALPFTRGIGQDSEFSSVGDHACLVCFVGRCANPSVAPPPPPTTTTGLVWRAQMVAETGHHNEAYLRSLVLDEGAMQALDKQRSELASKADVSTAVQQLMHGPLASNLVTAINTVSDVRMRTVFAAMLSAPHPLPHRVACPATLSSCAGCQGPPQRGVACRA